MRFALLTALVLTLCAPAAAQTPDTLLADRVNVFLDCDNCDFSFIRREASFVNYVRNRDDGDVHVLVTSRRTGSGGRTFTLDFIGRGPFMGDDARLTYSTSPDDTDDAERAGFVEVLKRGLFPYAARSGIASRLRVSFAGAEEAAPEVPAVDPWNAWVFRTNLGGSFTKEEQQSRYSVDGSLSANRVTETWRIESEAEFDYDERNFERTFEEDGEIVTQDITSTSERYRLDGRLIRSLTAHWSVGVFAGADSDTRFNNRLSAGVRPAVEYSIYPYDVAERKEFTVSYSVGVDTRSYLEETVYQKTSETLARQSLAARLNVTQPWGEAFARLEGSNYFHNLAFNRLQFGTFLSVRVYRGLSIYANVQAERIRDQLFLPRGDASLEDLLLSRRQLATAYELRGSLGLSYTFGSIYNNVVNTRL